MIKLTAVILAGITIIYALDRDSLRSVLPPLDVALQRDGAIISGYHTRYGLDTLGSIPVTGTFASDSFICVGQFYHAEDPQGTVFILHGYFDHTGTVRNGIEMCLLEHFSVAVMDLPGHGLSSGERGGINDFREYADAFNRFISICARYADTPYIFLGHSTGCAVGLEFSSSINDTLFKKIIFCAPLVRTALYHLSRLGDTVLHPLVTTLPRWFRNASHDRDFLTRFRSDPLQPASFPVRWAKAYYCWFDRVGGYPVDNLPILVIQGDCDRVVDWKYNLPWFKKRIKNVPLIVIEGARHQLMNESPEYLTVFSDTLKGILFNSPVDEK